ncbi:hypothetical protein [Bacillus sp. CGMCC 1.16541]|uniref:hypothetical protein n=1 Tax=Bacillus sp. CGMCC 1.16541 TaxID=2185143 RepID=UPI000D731F90|nr:hypothetical protein [Bacillus sp. CGMCC 1.16541]
MAIFHRFTWSEFLAFRKQNNMPPLAHEVQTGDQRAYAIVPLASFVVKPDATLTYYWEFEESGFYEKISFHHYGPTIQSTTAPSLFQKAFFWSEWLTLKDAIYHGSLDGETEELKIEHFGWSLMQDIGQWIDKQNGGVKVSQGKHDYHMDMYISYSRTGPKLCFYVLEGGLYMISIEHPNYELIFKSERLSEQEEASHVQQLTELATHLHQFLKAYTPVIDPHAGIILLDDEDWDEEGQ